MCAFPASLTRYGPVSFGAVAWSQKPVEEDDDDDDDDEDDSDDDDDDEAPPAKKPATPATKTPVPVKPAAAKTPAKAVATPTTKPATAAKTPVTAKAATPAPVKPAVVKVRKSLLAWGGGKSGLLRWVGSFAVPVHAFRDIRSL